MKKTRGVLAACLTICMLTASCRSGTTSESLPTSLSASTTPSSEIKGSSSFPFRDKGLSFDPYSEIEIYTDDTVLYLTQRGDSGTGASDLWEYAYNISTKNSVTFEQFEWDIASGDVLCMGNGLVYFFPMCGDEVNRLMELNTQTGTVTVRHELTLGYPLVFMEKISDTEFMYNVGFDVESNTGDSIRRFCFYRYNTQTHTSTLWKTYEFNPDTMIGNSSTLARKSGDFIYVLSNTFDGMLESELTKHQQAIEVYSLDGTLQNTLILPEKINYIVDQNGTPSDIWRFYKYNDFLFFSTIDNEAYIYQYNNGQLKEVTVPSTLTLIPMLPYSSFTTDQRYVYFSELDEITYPSMLILDTQTGGFSRLNLNIENEFNTVNYS